MYRILTYSSIISILIPLICCVIKYKTHSTILWVLFTYIIFSTLTEILSLFLPNYSIKNYFLSQNIFAVTEFLLISVLYYLEFKIKITQRIILYISIAYICFVLIELGITGKYLQANTIISLIEACILSMFAIYFFFNVQTELSIPRLTDYSFFWINCGVAIYFSTSIILFAFDDYISKCGEKEVEQLWGLHLFCNILYNILLSVGVWKIRQK